MSQSDIELARSAYAAFNRGDIAAALERLDPQIEWRMWDKFSREARVFHGHDGVREVFRTFEANFDDFRTEPHDFLSWGDRVVVPVRLTGRQKGGGERVSYELVQVWTSRSHLAVRLDVFASLEEAWAGVGGEGEPPTGRSASLEGTPSGDADRAGGAPDPGG